MVEVSPPEEQALVRVGEQVFNKRTKDFSAPLCEVFFGLTLDMQVRSTLVANQMFEVIHNGECWVKGGQ